MDLEFEEIKEYHALHSYVEQHYVAGKTNYLFVDEVQMCPKFELAINSLYSKGKYDIYVTGSNAFLLSADLATLFTGRYIQIHVFPFSFKEYCEYYDDVTDKDKLFDEYSFKGGLAGSYVYPNDRDRSAYIKEVYETIVTRDLVQKYALPDTTVLQRLSEFLMDNISNLTSPNKVSQLLNANNVTTNHVTVGKYIKYLCNEKYNKDTDFAVQMTALLKLNSVAYKLEYGKIESILDVSINKKDVSSISEKGLRELLMEAESYYKKGNKQIAVEKIWDAFERLKTYYSPSLNKAQSATKIIDDMSGSDTDFKSMYETEFKALTTIGNNFRIRHHETTKIDITDNRQYDYFYKRCLALVSVAILYLEGGTSA